ncbi:hypothetical protein X975_01253, partial [Stegodyphus mimosarum]
MKHGSSNKHFTQTSSNIVFDRGGSIPTSSIELPQNLVYTKTSTLQSSSELP